ncbi:hypothetical protein GCM10022221_68080 [Actinocorallia aurea]
MTIVLSSDLKAAADVPDVAKAVNAALLESLDTDKFARLVGEKLDNRSTEVVFVDALDDTDPIKDGIGVSLSIPTLCEPGHCADGCIISTATPTVYVAAVWLND